MARVAALLAARGIVVSEKSLLSRIADGDGGTLLAPSATVSWALDGGSLHLYDWAGATIDFAALLAAADALARARFAAVLVTTLYADDARLEHLEKLGFTRDSSEADVRAGEPAQTIALVREISLSREASRAATP